MRNFPGSFVAPVLSRRRVLYLAGGLVHSPQALAAPSRNVTTRHLIVILLRGAMDGLSTVVPFGDQHYREHRKDIAVPEPGSDGGALDIGSFFALHPSLPGLQKLFMRKEALIVHAVGGPWRTRSHFEAQDLLESGASKRLSSGWLNRAIALTGQKTSGQEGLALGVEVPLLLRGSRPVSTYALQSGNQCDPSVLAHIGSLMANDDLLGPSFLEGVRTRQANSNMIGQSGQAKFPADPFVALSAAAGRILAQAGGPRLAAIELGGWDTHSSQPARMAVALRRLDNGIQAMRTELGTAWDRTVVVTISEFGRTVRVNGTRGTDHGTAGVMLVLGGPVLGGKILTKWPGLKPSDLWQGRDLAITTDVRAVLKGVLQAHLGTSDKASEAIFPDSEDIAAITGLIKNSN